MENFYFEVDGNKYVWVSHVAGRFVYTSFSNSDATKNYIGDSLFKYDGPKEMLETVVRIYNTGYKYGINIGHIQRQQEIKKALGL